MSVRGGGGARAGATEIVALGERAWRFAIDDAWDRGRLLARLREIVGVTDAVIAEASGAVWFEEETAAPAIRVALAKIGESGGAREGGGARSHNVRVVYDGEDLGDVARAAAMTVDEVVAMHAGATYDVASLGFMPGFAYLRGLDPRLVLPRRASPRTRVPARSVAIAAGYTAIYPSPSPGGWHLLGEALDVAPFTDSGAAFATGDRVRFEPVTRLAAGPRAAENARAAATARDGAPREGERWLEVTAVRAPALLVDGGRPGYMHEGVPRGGPLVRAAFAAADAHAGNASGACGVELYGAIDIVARGGPITLADHRCARTLAENEALTVAPPTGARAGYLAVRGGIDVPLFLGSRTTLLSAQRGGLDGRPLARGARLVVGEAAPAHACAREAHRATKNGSAAILAGPDHDEAVLAALLTATFLVAPASDRTGTRLLGPALPPSMHSTRDRRSAPMACGAIELTPAGLIVLGPDHPTTGGYPVIAVLREHALDAFFATPPGGAVRFA